MKPSGLIPSTALISTPTSRSINTCPTSTETHLLPSRWKSEEMEQWVIRCTNFLFLKKTRESKTVATLNCSTASATQDDSTYTLGSSLFNVYITLSIRRGSLSPFSVALQLPRIIPIYQRRTGLGSDVRTAFSTDDLNSVQRLFKKGLLTAATVVAWYDYEPGNETSLFGVSFQVQIRNISADILIVSGNNEISKYSHLFNYSYVRV
jgi:hypothetical protein